MITGRHVGWVARVYRACLACLLSVLCAGKTAANPIDVAVVAGDNARHVLVAEALGERLASACGQPCSHPAEVTTVDTAEAAAYLSATTPDLVVTIGAAAARQVAELRLDIPTLFGFVPRNVWLQLEACCIADSTPRGRVLLDQPASRLLGLVRAVHPEAQRIGVLLGAATAARLAELNRAARAASVALQTEQVEAGDDVGRKLRQLAARVDVLLALPDRTVYNRNTVYPILLTTYSAGIPVIGFSSAIVRAGAAAGLFVSPRDGGEAIALSIHAYRTRGVFAVDEETLPYSIEVNDDVLRSLRLPARTATDLLEILKRSKP